VAGKSKQEIAYGFLRERILNGVYPPGYHIVVDKLVQEFSLSPSPIREAIRRLESDGLLINRPYSGVIVKQIDKQEYIDSMYTLAVLDGYAASMSAIRFPEDEFGLLIEANNKIKEALCNFDLASLGKLDREFHDLLNCKCENHYLLESIQKAYEQSNILRELDVFFAPSRVKESISEHERIIRLFQMKNVTEIETHVRRHRINTIEEFEKRNSLNNLSVIQRL
jgi:DNA-binding GntR family transcriptional regulator